MSVSSPFLHHFPPAEVFVRSLEAGGVNFGFILMGCEDLRYEPLEIACEIFSIAQAFCSPSSALYQWWASCRCSTLLTATPTISEGSSANNCLIAFQSCYFIFLTHLLLHRLFTVFISQPYSFVWPYLCFSLFSLLCIVVVSFEMAKNILPFHKKDAEAKPSKTPKDRRLRRFAFAPNWVRNEFIAFIGR